ncbi:uncharacterized protein KZ484_002883 [Pholidichthys leucotaenia]
MVWSRESEAERPPLSVILPRLYLGAESDVTQDRLASLGISYVLSVSRCSPQPAFLPCSRYLRIPIDDSLWADLLPWIPQALHFIDAAMSSGASVLVHCAAGISRSPALAVAYIMYRLEMDLDQAYRFVKERRPSISPNFNFLGQLQHFQGALSQKALGRDPFIHQLDICFPSVRVNQSHSSQNGNCQSDSDIRDSHRAQQQKLQAPNETLSQNLQQVHMSCEDTASSPREPLKPAANHTHLHVPPGSAALLEKRKSLTLSLTPLGVCPPSMESSIQQHRGGPTSKYLLSKETGERVKAQRDSGPHSSRTEEKEQGPLSPFSSTLNKLLGWGERLLLGGLFGQPVRMGQPALTYSC